MQHPHLKRIVRRLIPQEAVVRITRGPLRGWKWMAHSTTPRCWLTKYEADVLRACAPFVTRESTVFDVGANVGFFSLYFASRGARVHAFEPVDRNVHYLNRHLELNHVDTVLVVPSAVSERSGTGRFSAGDSHAEGRLDSSQGAPVSVLSLDDYCRQAGVMPSFVKVDVEGSECGVLEGAHSILAAGVPWMVECHSESLFEASVEIFRRFHYETVRVTSSHLLAHRPAFASRPQSSGRVATTS